VQELQATLPIGTVVGNRYIVEDLLGKGGFGAVYLVKDQRVKGNLFALKEVIDSDKKERLRFAFEGDVLNRLDHAALPRVYRAFEDDKRNRAYMLMDYIAGPNLETLRQQQPDHRFSLAQSLRMMAPIFDAVSFLHGQTPPIIHRDIKPSNIIVPTADDSTVLVDFGIAKEYNPDSTTTAIRRCSPGYGAPEQYAMGTNTRTDIYGLGATLYALLTGLVPEDAFYRMTQMSNGNVDPLEPVNHIVPAIPLAVSQAIVRAMAINSNERFATVQEFWGALNAFQPGRETPAPAVPAAPVEPVTPFPLVHDPASTPRVNVVPLRDVPSAYGRKKTTPERRRILLFMLLALVLLLLIATGTAVGFLLSSGTHQTARISTPVPTHHAGVLTTPTAKPTSAPTATPTPVPTFPPRVYPQVAGTHYGTVKNNNNGDTAHMTVTFQQSQATLSGNVTINVPLSGSGPITSGYVRTNGYIQFIVQPDGLAPLFFSGSVQTSGTMGGSYCSLNASGNCDPNAGGQGIWSTGASSGRGGS
jgi:eukaryotic-like serine/threonine-protein kinase